MDKFTKYTLVILSIELAGMGALVSHLSYKLGFEQGKLALMAEWDNGKGVGTCYIPGGCGK